MKRSAPIALAVMLAGCAASAPTAASTWQGCTAYTDQAQAQAAWEAAGRPPGADGDSDGRVCESLAGGRGGEAKTTGCKRPAKPVAVTFSRARYPNIVRHIELSWKRGYPRVLRINRAGADGRRDQLLEGIPTRPGYDRDEAPAAVLRATVRASVRYVPSSENRSAGSRLGSKIGPYCDGVRVRYRFTP